MTKVISVTAVTLAECLCLPSDVSVVEWQMKTGKPKQKSYEPKASQLATADNWLNRAVQASDGLGSAEQRIGQAEDMLRTLDRAVEQAADLVVQVVLRHQIASLRANFLQKPFTLKSLAAKVREVLDSAAAASAGQSSAPVD